MGNSNKIICLIHFSLRFEMEILGQLIKLTKSQVKTSNHVQEGTTATTKQNKKESYTDLRI